MKHWIRNFSWEGRALARSPQLWIVCGALLVAGLLAIWTGERKLERSRSEIASLPGHYEQQMEGIAKQFSPQGEAGYVAYYAFMPTSHPLSALSALSIGVRDIVPSVVWVRLLGIEGQLYEADLGNPAAQALGSFDLAFVFAALAPLALLVLSYDIVSREREQGRLSLLLAQGGSIASLLAVRMLLRLLAVGGTCGIVFAVAIPWVDVALDATAWQWLGVALANLLCWTAIATFLAIAIRSVAAGLASSIAVWVASVAFFPAVLNVAVSASFPVDEGFDLTLEQRQNSHGAWDKPRAETMEAFFETNPQWSDTQPVEGRFAWRWYYAMHEVADESVADEARAYRENLLERQRWQARFAWLAPSAYAQMALDNRASSDLDAHLAYLEEVRVYHQELRDHFYPLVFAEAEIEPADYAAFPPYEAKSIQSTAGVSVFPLLALAGLFFVLSGWQLPRAHRL